MASLQFAKCQSLPGWLDLSDSKKHRGIGIQPGLDGFRTRGPAVKKPTKWPGLARALSEKWEMMDTWPLDLCDSMMIDYIDDIDDFMSHIESMKVIIYIYIHIYGVIDTIVSP